MWLGQNSLAEFQQHFFKKRSDGSYEIMHQEIQDIPAKLKCLDEVCMNAVDEYNRNLNDKSIRKQDKMKKLVVSLSKNRERITVRDDGRGIPMKNASDVFLHLMYGENFDDLSQKEHIAGQNGVGVSLVRIVSRFFKVDTYHQGRRYSKVFTMDDAFKEKLASLSLSPALIEKIALHFDEQGHFDSLTIVDEKIKKQVVKFFKRSQLAAKLEKVSETLHGTEVTFELDSKYFNHLETSFQENFIEQYLQDLAMTNPGLVVEFNHQNKKKEFVFKNGLVDIFASSGRNYYKLIHHDPKDHFRLESILLGEEGKSLSWVNSNFVSLGGSSIEYLHNRIYDEIRKKPSLLTYEKRLKYDITRNDIRNCLHLYNNFHILAPRFKSQDKSYLINDLKEEIRQIVDRNLDKIIRKLDLVNKIKEVIHKKVKMRELANVGKEMKKTNRSVIVKFIPCTSKSRHVSKTLFIGEGDSAIAGLRPVRDPQTQALFPLRGKPLNIRGMPLVKAMNNQEYRNIVSILGLPFQEKQEKQGKQEGKIDFSKMPFKKIVIITDADFDGYAIRSLMLSFFYEYWPDLFSEGFIYIAEAPLYEVELKKGAKKQVFYCIDDEEFSTLMKKAEADKLTLLRKKRNKGLGETSKPAMRYAITHCLTKIQVKSKKKATFTQNLWFHKSLAHERRTAISKYEQLYLED